MHQLVIMSEKTDPAGIKAIENGVHEIDETAKSNMSSGEKSGYSIKDGEVEAGSVEDS